MVLATVELALSEWRSPGPSRWMVWRPDPAHYANFDDYDGGFDIRLHGRGEAHPRDTANAAIQLALTQLGDQIPDEDRNSLAIVAEILRPTLENKRSRRASAGSEQR